jgi:hypothetical protein
MTIETVTTSNVEGQNDAVSFLDAFDCIAYFFDHAHDFVTHDCSGLERGTAVVHVKVAAANSAGRDS